MNSNSQTFDVLSKLLESINQQFESNDIGFDSEEFLDSFYVISIYPGSVRLQGEFSQCRGKVMQVKKYLPEIENFNNSWDDDYAEVYFTIGDIRFYITLTWIMDSISKDGFYVGPEVHWNVDDVEAIAISDFELELSEEDLKRVLIASFQDNDWLMERMHDCIKDTIHYMLQNGELTKPTTRI